MRSPASTRAVLGRSSRTQSGFSFIEILVVMGIIAVLAGLGMFMVNIFLKKGPQFETQNLLNTVRTSVVAWKGKHGAYPSMRLSDLQAAAGGVGPLIKHAGNRENEPIETLYQALYWPSLGSDPELDAEKALRNTDDDRFAQVPLGLSRGPELMEIVDAWGNPLVYFVNTAYAQADRDPPTYALGNNRGTVQPKPMREEGGGFVNPNGFQLFSMGEDGQPNTEDDIAK